MKQWTLALVLSGAMAFWSVGCGPDGSRDSEPGSPPDSQGEREPGS